MRKAILVCFVLLISKFSCAQVVYTFNGKGNWSVSSNWSNNIIPPSTLPSGSTINISPIVGDTCFLNISQIVSQGASLIITTGAKFVILGDLDTIKVANPPSISICNQTWMTKDLDVATYRNGDSIPQVTDATEWASLTSGAWCWYNNDSATYADTYGRLYNWYAVNDPRGLAPSGWHIPDNSEYSILSTCLGGALNDTIAGAALKETGTTHWESPNVGATNSSGFTGLPGGKRNESGIFSGISTLGYWWEAGQITPVYGIYRLLSRQDISFAGYGGTIMTNGFSIRCVRD